MVTWAFLAAAAVAVIFALLTVALRNPILNVLSLVVVFFAMAAIFALLGMDFLAAVQVIVYSGAILVLFLFVIMLLNIRHLGRLGGGGRPFQAFVGSFVAAALGGLVLAIAGILPLQRGAVLPGTDEIGTAIPIGRALISTHLFVFEFITLLLAAAIVGAVYLGKRSSR
jgi:NADH-quinone oxidoreductase subunit J